MSILLKHPSSLPHPLPHCTKGKSFCLTASTLAVIRMELPLGSQPQCFVFSSHKHQSKYNLSASPSRIQTPTPSGSPTLPCRVSCRALQQPPVLPGLHALSQNNRRKTCSSYSAGVFCFLFFNGEESKVSEELAEFQDQTPMCTTLNHQHCYPCCATPPPRPGSLPPPGCPPRWGRYGRRGVGDGCCRPSQEVVHADLVHFIAVSRKFWN